MRLSHHALELEAQPPNELDGCPVIFWQNNCHPTKLCPDAEVPHGIEQHLLSSTEPTVEHHDVHVGVELRPHLRRCREPDGIIAQ